jgi:hypothetical protein
MPQTRVDAVPGQRYAVEGCFSEVMMHFRLAGKPIEVSLEPSRYMNGELAPDGRMMGQVWVDGKQFSFPVTTGEAGFYQDDKGYYLYV